MSLNVVISNVPMCFIADGESKEANHTDGDNLVSYDGDDVEMKDGMNRMCFWLIQGCKSKLHAQLLRDSKVYHSELPPHQGIRKRR